MKNIIYDATILANGVLKNCGRSGIYFTALNILKVLSTKKNINLALFCTRANFENLKLVLSQEFKNTNFNIILDEIYPSCYLNLKTKREQLKQDRKIFQKNLLQIVLLLISPLIKLMKVFHTLIAKFKINRYDIFISPFYSIPDLVRHTNLKKYTILYDVIPMILEDYKDNGGWFKKIFESLNINDYYFAISEYTRQDFLKHCSNINPEHFFTAHLACSETFKPISDDKISTTKLKYNIPPKTNYIFSLCTLEPRKNLLRAVKTFVQFIHKHNINNLVFVLGGGHYDSFIPLLEKELDNFGQYKDKIIKAGYIDDEDLPALYSGAEWFVYTSQYEGFGLPPLEAMSCGCPVITSNNSSLPEVVGDAGIMIDWDSDEQHIQAYERYYFNENIRKQNMQKGIERAEAFSWEKCVNNIFQNMTN